MCVNSTQKKCILIFICNCAFKFTFRFHPFSNSNVWIAGVYFSRTRRAAAPQYRDCNNNKKEIKIIYKHQKPDIYIQHFVLMNKAHITK